MVGNVGKDYKSDDKVCFFVKKDGSYKPWSSQKDRLFFRSFWENIHNLMILKC